MSRSSKNKFEIINDEIHISKERWQGSVLHFLLDHSFIMW